MTGSHNRRSSNSGINSGTNPSTTPGSNPESNPESSPDASPASIPGSSPDLSPASGHGARPGSRFSSLLRIAGFALRNPRLAWHNLNSRKLRTLYRQLGGNADDLHQWLDARIPESSQTISLELESGSDREPISFPTSEQPEVSIIIPAYNHFDLTFSLLKSIRRHTDMHYEVIIADDCSTDDTRQVDQYATGVRHIRTKRNSGFLRNCNHAAAEARGQFLVFLNNDTNVTAGWLEALLTPFSDPATGITGPRVLYADGRLQEAGGIIWQDASGWNYGRMQNPEKPAYNYLKEVDYVSGCCLVIRQKLWEAIGGFDERFAPAYYEDTDLCFAAREHGFRVIYQPAASIIHLEGATHGRDVSKGVKQHQTRNKRNFAAKWRNVLDTYPANGDDVFHARDRSRWKPCVLFIDHYVPHYDRDAGSRSVLMYLQLLCDMGANVKFVADSFYRHEPYSRTLQAMGIEVFYGVDAAKNIQRWMKAHDTDIDTVFLNRPQVAERYLETLAAMQSRKVYFGHDLHFLRCERQAALAVEPDVSDLLREAQRWRETELKVMRQMDVVYFPSTLEVDILQNEHGITQTTHLPLFTYPPREAPLDYDPDSRQGLLFVGSFIHPPNTDAVRWFHNAILPQLDTAALPVHVVGAHPPTELQEKDSDDFRILGQLSEEDLTALYASVRLVIVPLRYGAGVKGKVLEALYNGVPVVTTAIGAEGIENIESAVEIADNAEEFSATINQLCKAEDEVETVAELEVGDEDRERLKQMSNAGQALINSDYTPERVSDIFQRDFLWRRTPS